MADIVKRINFNFPNISNHGIGIILSKPAQVKNGMITIELEDDFFDHFYNEYKSYRQEFKQ